MSKIRLFGDTSGYVDLAAPTVADNSSLSIGDIATQAYAATVGPGKILQINQTVYSVETVVPSTTYSTTGLSCSITPSFASSKIMVFVSQQCYSQIASNVDQGVGIRILRDSTQVFENSRAFVLRAGTGASGFTLGETIIPLMYLDSPSTTSEITYSTDIKAFTTATSGQVVAQLTGVPSTMTLMEVAQ